jgi:hypothetical protein
MFTLCKLKTFILDYAPFLPMLLFFLVRKCRVKRVVAGVSEFGNDLEPWQIQVCRVSFEPMRSVALTKFPRHWRKYRDCCVRKGCLLTKAEDDPGRDLSHRRNRGEYLQCEKHEGTSWQKMSHRNEK